MTQITIPGQIIKMDAPSGIDPVWYDKLKVLIASSNLFDSLFGDSSGSSHITASLGADVALAGTGTYFDGPSVAQGTKGTWWVSGSVTVTDTAGGDFFSAKLWDGTTVIASSRIITAAAANSPGLISLSGFIANPAGNLRISVRCELATTGKILFNQSGNSRDSTISAFRIA